MRKSHATMLAGLAIALCPGWVATVHGAWTAVENFEDGAWDNHTLRGAAVSVVSESGNQVGKWSVTGNNQGVDIDIPDIVDGTTGTIFYRVKWSRGPNMNKAAINNSQAWVTRSTWESGRYDRIMDASAWQTITTPGFTTGQIADNTWYTYWMVIDHTADTWSLYGQKEGTNSPTLLSYSGDSTFALAYGTTTPAQQFRLMNTGGGGTYDAWVDDLYVDIAGANLGDPTAVAEEDIPEPATMALLGLGAAGLGGYFRRRVRTA